MKEALKKKYDLIIDWFSKIGNLVSRKWLLYSCIRTVYLVTFIPALALLNALYVQPIFLATIINLLFWIIYLTALPLLGILFLLDTRRGIAVKTTPQAFVYSEKISWAVEKLFFVSLISLPFSVLIGFTIERYGLEAWIAPYLTFIVMPLIFFMVGFALTSMFDYIEKQAVPTLLESLPASARKHLTFLTFYVHPTLQARARLCVILDTLPDNPSMRMIKQKTCLFKEALGIYNNHLTVLFDFAIREPDKFYKYVRLTSFSTEKKKINELKKNLAKLVGHLEKSEHPFEIVKTMKNMIEEPTSNLNEVYEEIEIAPRRYKNWILAHSDLLGFIIALISFVSFLVFQILE